jgi:hypothetical protein
MELHAVTSQNTVVLVDLNHENQPPGENMKLEPHEYARNKSATLLAVTCRFGFIMK